MPIDSVRVGDRVLTYLPGDSRQVDGVRQNIDAAKWNIVQMVLPKSAGGEVRINLLRPKEWLYEQPTNEAGQVWLNLPELDAAGFARVVSIDACPDIPDGPGQLVLSTFHHASGEVYDVSLSSGSSLGVTAHHPVWSVDRAEWIPVNELEPGETLETVNGTTQFVSAIPHSEPAPVFNLEVDTDHAYRVGDEGVLVHNESLSCQCKIDRYRKEWMDTGSQGEFSGFVIAKEGLGNTDLWGIACQLAGSGAYKGTIAVALICNKKSNKIELVATSVWDEFPGRSGATVTQINGSGGHAEEKLSYLFSEDEIIAVGASRCVCNDCRPKIGSAKIESPESISSINDETCTADGKPRRGMSCSPSPR